MTDSSGTSKSESIDRARLLAGLSDLSQAFVKGEQGGYGMRIPAEPYHDGDLVCGGAMRLIVEQNTEIGRLRAALTLIGDGPCSDLNPAEECPACRARECLAGETAP